MGAQRFFAEKKTPLLWALDDFETQKMSKYSVLICGRWRTLKHGNCSKFQYSLWALKHRINFVFFTVYCYKMSFPYKNLGVHEQDFILYMTQCTH